MACSYASVEIERTPEIRVIKRCLFYDKPCAEVRAKKMCPLQRRGTGLEASRREEAGLEPGTSEVLKDELQRFDSIPTLGEEFKSGEVVKPRKREKAEKEVEVEAARSEAALLEAELSDFIDKMEPRKEKPTGPRSSPSAKSQTEEGKRRQKPK